MSKKKAAAAALVLSIVALIVAAPTIASGFAKSHILAEAEARGVPLSIDGLDLGWSQTTLVGTCVEGLQNRPLACIDRLVVELPLLKAARGELDRLSIRVSGGHVDASAEMGTPEEIRALVESWRPTRSPDQSDGPTDGRSNPQRDRELPTVHVEGFSIQVAGNGAPFDGVEIVSAAFEGLDAMSAHVEMVNLSAELLPVEVELSDGYRIAASWFEDDRWLRVEPSGPIVVEPQPGVSASIEAIEVHYPRTGAIEGVVIEVPGQEPPIFIAERLEVELREFTTDIEQLYIARAQVDSLRADILLDDDGTPAMLNALRPAPEEGSGEADGEEGEVVEPSEPAELDEPLWADRRWFEKVPQTIHVRNGEVTFRRGQEHSLRASAIEMDYAIRAVRPQADVDLSLELESAGDPAGDAVLHLEWNWATQALRLDLELNDFALSALETPSPDLESLELGGVLDLTTRVRERDDGSIADFSGTLDMSGFAISLGLLSNRLELGDFRYTWDAASDEERALDVQTGAGSLAGAEFTFTPRLHGFNYHRNRLFETLDVRATVPDQDANTLLAAVPTALLGDVAEARMSGTWGYAIDFPITWGEEPEDGGRRPIVISPSTELEVRDSDLHLEHLPESVDVRRLNQAFTFSFRGPDNSVNRTINARAPRAYMAGEPGAADDDSPRENSWARLDEISYYVTAATLYREDGRFFRNLGINWYQWRAVMEEAWLSRELGRGASTVSMQLVKNVFLTHERSIERKLQELFLTYWMTRLVPKERILETYLNIIEWGPGINGVVEASRHYFGKSPADLTLEESVWLSSIVPAPVRRGAQRSQGVAADWSLRHCRDIITGMHGRGWITASESEKARTTEIHFVTSTERPDRRSAPVLEVDPQDLTDLRIGIPAPPTELSETRLVESPTERVRALIAGQISLRP